MASRKRGSDAVAAVRATVAGIADGIELDEHDEQLLAAVYRAHNRAADLDRDAADQRRKGGSSRRITELLGEARLQETQANRWAAEVVKRAEEVSGGAAPGKSWQHVKAARARWSGTAAGIGKVN